MARVCDLMELIWTSFMFDPSFSFACSALWVRAYWARKHGTLVRRCLSEIDCDSKVAIWKLKAAFDNIRFLFGQILADTSNVTASSWSLQSWSSSWSAKLARIFGSTLADMGRIWMIDDRLPYKNFTDDRHWQNADYRTDSTTHCKNLQEAGLHSTRYV